MTVQTLPTIAPKTTADVLRHAALVLEERGWVQGKLADADTGAVCALGALNVAVTGAALGTKGEDSDFAAVERAALMAELFTNGQPLTTWNDNFAHAREDVTALFRKAAEMSDD